MKNEINIQKLLNEFDVISKKVDFMIISESFYNFESSTKNFRILTSLLTDISRTVFDKLILVCKYTFT